MDKRFKSLTLAEQLDLRRQAIEDVLANPQWPLAQAVRHIKKTLRLTSAEMAKLSGVAYRTLQDIEQNRSSGTVQTMEKLFGILGLKLGVVRAAPSPSPPTPPASSTARPAA